MSNHEPTSDDRSGAAQTNTGDLTARSGLPATRTFITASISNSNRWRQPSLSPPSRVMSQCPGPPGNLAPSTQQSPSRARRRLTRDHRVSVEAKSTPTAIRERAEADGRQLGERILGTGWTPVYGQHFETHCEDWDDEGQPTK
jgi:hypothetical protein